MNFYNCNGWPLTVQKFVACDKKLFSTSNIDIVDLGRPERFYRIQDILLALLLYNFHTNNSDFEILQ